MKSLTAALVPVLLALFSSDSYAQGPPNWPSGCSDDPRLQGICHDGFHSVTALGVAEGFRIFGLSEDKRYVIGTLALPLAQELFDLAYWYRFSALDGWNREAVRDFMTYQLPWAYYLARRGKWLHSLYVTGLYAGFLYWRYYGDSDSLRDSFWLNPFLVGSSMAIGGALGTDRKNAYIAANVILIMWEGVQFAAGHGEWEDVALGVVLPTPFLFGLD